LDSEDEAFAAVADGADDSNTAGRGSAAEHSVVVVVVAVVVVVVEVYDGIFAHVFVD